MSCACQNRICLQLFWTHLLHYAIFMVLKWRVVQYSPPWFQRPIIRTPHLDIFEMLHHINFNIVDSARVSFTQTPLHQNVAMTTIFSLLLQPLDYSANSWWVSPGNLISTYYWSRNKTLHPSRYQSIFLTDMSYLDTMYNNKVSCYSMITCIISGIILSSGTTLLRSSDIRYRLNASNAKCIITNAECADHVDEVSQHVLLTATVLSFCF